VEAAPVMPAPWSPSVVVPAEIPPGPTGKSPVPEGLANVDVALTDVTVV